MCVYTGREVPKTFPGFPVDYNSALHLYNVTVPRLQSTCGTTEIAITSASNHVMQWLLKVGGLALCALIKN